MAAYAKRQAIIKGCLLNGAYTNKVEIKNIIRKFMVLPLLLSCYNYEFQNLEFYGEFKFTTQIMARS